jgi:outer membrane immunogenic protein
MPLSRWRRMGCTVVKNLLVLLCGLASVAGSAFAADLPKREIGPAPALAPVFTWAGFYIGTQTAAINLDGNVRTSGNAGSTIAEVASLRRPGSLSLDDTNLASGAQVGFNVQYGAIVLGLEGDLAFADVSPRSLFFSPASDPTFSAKILNGSEQRGAE